MGAQANVGERTWVTYYNGTDDTLGTRLDVLFGIGVLRPEWLCIVPDIVDAG
ncbi:hypothetical protein Gbth_023_052 [Gluconobacter thailandicus F149-1 = NBRC 100600]|uniref:Uncharacterized protein n=1 Tax=Gluconobacter thailandicus NBRC 3257 TaxID=1381097 RepID=A0ABQ0J066_GLUTH|nr:hypothetical protein [Gluconobacter thailandicus]GAC86664.1 hypothetical protein NBRC3255_0325 [Gluconobacter thailandicus NBRC 3255]GAD27850.1 hypothetical protein NBRC3257_2849 [Gluconobacter thailandicus NBRC 3257]GAN93300.1 hypothetical protein Gbth_023_052 [Gluconobacter thailandicus F149-1 = NBRC 100600]GBR59573.1 hypothetical protein AA100600_1383 [Gluconobacter thailandicus F149-1 = NBRC 100600]GEL86870.1 hypothetical protein GTH01_12280 [Gluconobacter thailandicus F149-1 = NBRC 100